MDKKILERYNSQEGADSYRAKFHRSWSERINNRHEQRLLARLLNRLPAGTLETALDIPCGYGRLFPLLREVAPRIVESDYSVFMLENARRFHQASGQAAEAYVQNDALQLQFQDRSFDLVLSVRLCHHIRDHAERIRYLREITRVSRSWVIFTYADAATAKNMLREVKRRVSSKRPKWTLRRMEVEKVAKEAGFEVHTSVPLSRVFSLHRYVLLRRNQA